MKTGLASGKLLPENESGIKKILAATFYLPGFAVGEFNGSKVSLEAIAPLALCAVVAVGFAFVLFFGLIRRRRSGRGSDLPSEQRAPYIVRVHEADVTSEKSFQNLAEARQYADDAASETENGPVYADVLDEGGAIVYRGRHYGHG